jgi:hypothetical protein
MDFVHGYLEIRTMDEVQKPSDAHRVSVYEFFVP